MAVVGGGDQTSREGGDGTGGRQHLQEEEQQKELGHLIARQIIRSVISSRDEEHVLSPGEGEEGGEQESRHSTERSTAVYSGRCLIAESRDGKNG